MVMRLVNIPEYSLPPSYIVALGSLGLLGVAEFIVSSAGVCSICVGLG